jgi:uncharacterized membrane protein
MSRKCVEQDGPGWVKQGIISEDQYNNILLTYGEKKQRAGLLPILGSILIGLGLLSFIAANWNGFFPLFRLLLIIVVMVGFYATGDFFLRRGQEKLGIALIGTGLFAFGGGIVLIGQMFHLISYNALSFIVWGVAGALLTSVYRSRYFYLLSLLIFNIAQLYSLESLHSFSITAFILMVATLGAYLWNNQNHLLSWMLNISIIIQLLILIDSKNWFFIWIMIPLMVLYTLGDWLPQRQISFPMQSAALLTAFVFEMFMVLVGTEDYYFDTHVLKVNPLYFLPIAALLLAISLAGKFLQSRQISLLDWIVLLPFFYIHVWADAVYMLALFIFSLYMLWRGYAEEWRLKINLGTILFITSTMLAYGKLTWAFMDKSVFFLLGGLLLLGLSWYLNRRKKDFFIKDAEAIRDDK